MLNKMKSVFGGKKFIAIIASIIGLFLIVSSISAYDGSGTPGDPYQITDCIELQDMNSDLAAHYILMNDIDCSDTVSWNSGAGFLPISTFTGTLDGSNHTITELYINKSSWYVGLFGRGSYCSINNIGIENINITNETSWNVGGLIGENYRCNIDKSYSTGNIEGLGNVGGLVGFNNFGTINNSYSTSNVSGNSGSLRVGGLVGYNRGTVGNSYSAGIVTATHSKGGLIGAKFSGPFIPVNSYWDIDSSGLSTSAGGEGKTTAQMMSQSTFIGWDFDNIWGICEGDTYPWLRWQDIQCIIDSDGDGVFDDVDMCLGSVADDISLNPNQYAQNVDFGPFEVGPNNNQSIVYDMSTTFGCTCKQIVEELGAGKGHLKKGCSPSLMEEWTGVSANPDRKARVGKKK